jgi:hypothetical protein
LIEDSGEHLWQFDYWDNLITDERELEGIRKYIREYPANWSRDRYGACTSYSFGNLSLLNEDCIAFVASQGFLAGALRPRRLWEGRAKARRTDMGEDANRVARRTDIGEDANRVARRCDMGENIVADGFSRPLISTFTSAQEREALRRALAKGRRVIQVVPQGIPPESEMLPALLKACREGRALVVSPQPPLSSLNKKVATWCNEYVLRHAREIWVGDISPNGMLNAMISRMMR